MSMSLGPLGIGLTSPLVGKWGGAALPSLYLGQVATKSRIPTANNTTNKQLNSRSHHIARDDIASLQILLPNWYWTTAGEQNAAGSITYSASIEYPAGTFTQVKFSAANTSVVTSGSSVLSDAVAVSIPNGAAFWVRIYGTSASGIIFLGGSASPQTAQSDTANGELMEYAVSGVTDKTMGGTITNTVTTPSYSIPIFCPTAIVAMTRKPSVYCKGDSRVWAYGDVFDSSGDLGELARSVGASFGYINIGCPGDTIAAYLLSKTKRLALATYCSHILDETGINDIRSGGSGSNRTSAAVITDLQTAYADYTGKRILRTTIPPSTTSSDSFATTANQTLNGNEAQRVIFNNAVRAALANVVAYFDVADAMESARDSGKWKVDGTTFKYTIDGLHESQFGYLAIQSSGAINPALISRAGL